MFQSRRYYRWLFLGMGSQLWPPITLEGSPQKQGALHSIWHLAPSWICGRLRSCSCGQHGDDFHLPLLVVGPRDHISSFFSCDYADDDDDGGWPICSHCCVHPTSGFSVGREPSFWRSYTWTLAWACLDIMWRACSFSLLVVEVVAVSKTVRNEPCCAFIFPEQRNLRRERCCAWRKRDLPWEKSITSTREFLKSGTLDSSDLTAFYQIQVRSLWHTLVRH